MKDVACVSNDERGSAGSERGETYNEQENPMPETVLSEPRHKVCIERGVSIKMRDGVVLRADVYRPDADGRYPVIVERVAYELVSRCTSNGEFFASRGFVFVGQNVRGTFASEGEWHPLSGRRLGRQPRRLRYHRMGRNAALVQRKGGDGRWFLLRILSVQWSPRPDPRT